MVKCVSLQRCVDDDDLDTNYRGFVTRGSECWFMTQAVMLLNKTITVAVNIE